MSVFFYIASPPLTSRAVPQSYFQSCMILITNFPLIKSFSNDPHVTSYFIVNTSLIESATH